MNCLPPMPKMWIAGSVTGSGSLKYAGSENLTVQISRVSSGARHTHTHMYVFMYK